MIVVQSNVVQYNVNLFFFLHSCFFIPVIIYNWVFIIHKCWDHVIYIHWSAYFWNFVYSAIFQLSFLRPQWGKHKSCLSLWLVLAPSSFVLSLLFLLNNARVFRIFRYFLQINGLKVTNLQKHRFLRDRQKKKAFLTNILYIMISWVIFNVGIRLGL